MMNFTYGLFIAVFCFPQSEVEILINQGYDLYQQEDYKEAIATFEKALAYDSTNAEIHYLIGASKSFLGDKKEAMKSLDMATSIKMDYAAAYYEKGYIYLVDQNARAAIKEFDKVIQHNPGFTEAYVSRGTAKCMINDKVGAEKDWKIAKELGADYSEYMVCE